MRKKKNKHYTQEEFDALPTKRKSGEVRADGYLFSSYGPQVLKDGTLTIREIWSSPRSFRKSRDSVAKYYRKNKIELNRKRKEKLRAGYGNYRETQKEGHRRFRERNRAARSTAQKERNALTLGFYRQLPEQKRLMIDAFYDCARRVTECTGIKHQVDHIAHIFGDGWHVPSNLQVVPQSVNIRKGRNAFVYAEQAA